MFDTLEGLGSGAFTERPGPAAGSTSLSDTVLVYVASADAGGSATGPAGHGASTSCATGWPLRGVP